MTDVKDFDPSLAETELAYQILKASGEAKNFRDLMQQVFAVKSIPFDNHQLMAAIHTQINLDNRFAFLGQGNWGLREWTQGRVVRRTVPILGRNTPIRRRSLQDEMEYEDGEYNDSYDSTANEEEDEWEE